MENKKEKGERKKRKWACLNTMPSMRRLVHADHRHPQFSV
jgi:hypothetical protein